MNPVKAVQNEDQGSKAKAIADRIFVLEKSGDSGEQNIIIHYCTIN